MALVMEMVLVNEMGFVQGKPIPCNFYHPEGDIMTVVHRDDFTSLPAGDLCDWLADELRNHLSLKVRGVLGSGPKNAKSIRILNRIVSWNNDGITYESDQGHAEIIVKQLKMNETGVKLVANSGIKGDLGETKHLDSTTQHLMCYIDQCTRC